ncbi:MAG: hypothetical protein ACR2IJ_04105, partial [Fluviibacter sp.]
SFSVRRPSARIQTLDEYRSQKVFEETLWHLPEAEVEGSDKMTVPGSDQKLRISRNVTGHFTRT